MSEQKRYARKPESYLTVNEILSAKKISGEYESENGVTFSKVVFIAAVENKFVKPTYASMAVTDGGDPIWIRAWEEDSVMIEMANSGDYVLVAGRVVIQKKDNSYYINPSSIEKIPAIKKDQFIRYWYLEIVRLRIMGGNNIPRVPFQSILDEEGIKYTEIDENWIKINMVDKPEPRMVVRTHKEEPNAFDKTKKSVEQYIKSKKEIDYQDLLDWGTENEIVVTTIENVIIDLLNDGLIKEINEEKNKFKYQGD